MLINVKHPLQHFLEREISAEGFSIDVVLLLPQLLRAVTPVPDIDIRRFAPFGSSLDLFHRVLFRVEFRLQASLNLFDKIERCSPALGHSRLRSVVRPRFVSELVSDRCSQLDSLLQKIQILVAGSIVANQIELLAGRLARRIVHDSLNLERHVRVDLVLVPDLFVAVENRLRHSYKFFLGKQYGRVGVVDINLELCLGLAQLLAKILDFLLLILRQIKPGSSIVSQNLIEQPLIFSLQLRIGRGKRFDRFVDVLAIVESDPPFIKFVNSLYRSFAHFGVGMRLLQNFYAVLDIREIELQIVHRPNGVAKGHLF